MTTIKRKGVRLFFGNPRVGRDRDPPDMTLSPWKNQCSKSVLIIFEHRYGSIRVTMHVDRYPGL